MSLLTDILAWTTTDLTAWQRDAARRLVQRQDLTQEDFDDLYAMLKAAHGLADPENRSPVPLAREHLPSPAATSPPVILTAIRDLANVNRIPPGQNLRCSPKGMTVVYGENASGKSGYSRVLKSACRARDQAEIVLTDAYDPRSGSSTPEAAFEVQIGGLDKELVWKRGADSPAELSTIAVFDSRCARAYLDSEQDVAYLPYGLDIVENLARVVLPQLTRRLDAEIGAIDADTTPFADLLGNTAVGKMIALLSQNTDAKYLSALGTLSASDDAQLARLDKTLAETDPRTRAQSVRLSAQRVQGLISRIDAAVAWVKDPAVQRVRAIDDEAEASIEAEAIAAKSFRAGEALLPGTGEDVWKRLFEAARRFSTDAAYTTEAFPFVGRDAKCVLCQMPLDKEASQRMQRFDAFVHQDTARVAAETRTRRGAVQTDLAMAPLSFRLDDATTEELSQLSPAPLQGARDFEAKVEARRAWLLDALRSHMWEDAPMLDGDPRPAFLALSTNLSLEAGELERAANAQERQALETERAELRARADLSPRLKAVLELIQRIRAKAKLAGCKNDLRTKPISDKAREFASGAVTEALKKALDREFKALRVEHVKTKLNERVEHGKMKYKLVLDLPRAERLELILSEGEQRAIAIGSFLAELTLAEHSGGIVFDDPVSSLDHIRRKLLACRLVEEAKKRQVLVFTHDTVFLGELTDQVQLQNVDHVVQYLEWKNNSPGFVSSGLPWEHQSVKERLDLHEKAQRELAQRWPVYPNETQRGEVRDQYGLLRATIERAIQDVVFNGVVKRYRDWTRVDKLDDVVGFTQAEYGEIARLHKSCCEVVPAHDPPSAKNAAVPDPTQLGKDIADLRAVIQAIKTRRKEKAATPVVVSSTAR